MNEDNESRVRTLEDENQRLRAELAEYENAAFASLRDSKLSDSSVKREFAAICEAIEGWMEGILVDVDPRAFKRHFENILHDKQDVQAHQILTDVCRNLLDPVKLGDCQYSDFLFISYVAMNFLFENIFNCRYPLAIPSRQTNLVGEVENAMEAQLKDQGSISKWRSDTLSVLASQPASEDQKRKAVDRLLDEAESTISTWLPSPRTFAKYKHQFRHDIVKPAVELHQEMSISLERYAFKVYKPAPGPLRTPPRSGVMYRDIGNWRAVQGQLVESIVSGIYPEIVRQDSKNGVFPVYPPVVVVTVEGGQVLFRHLLGRSLTGGDITADRSEGERSKAEDSPRRARSDMELPHGERREKESDRSAGRRRHHSSTLDQLALSAVEYISRPRRGILSKDS